MEAVLKYLENKTARDWHSINQVIKGNYNTSTREDVARVKKHLEELSKAGKIEISGNLHTQLDIVNNDGHTDAGYGGQAQPTKYHNFDSLNIVARGLRSTHADQPKSIIAPEPRPKKEGVQRIEDLIAAINNGTKVPAAEVAPVVEVVPEPVIEAPVVEAEVLPTEPSPILDSEVV